MKTLLVPRLPSLVSRPLSLVSAAVVAVAAATTVAARTVNVTSITDTSASLAFGGADGAAYTLAWGYGASDGGSATNAWDTFEGLGTVAAAVTAAVLLWLLFRKGTADSTFSSIRAVEAAR